ncbi:sugar ABC transporter permease [Reticulibacter mediterranei]|uniref:Xylose transport system permease protein XylH n=1 Tax=Reticulibacter mediterranei TaxID=2778369 RepID=A0A8J3IXI2_9CHLR|nr:ABC transporter permease [Reticulibacter mediterranei]GHO97086.1 sugar ABC transporter permease [Reticulibacter mediterranei]
MSITTTGPQGTGKDERVTKVNPLRSLLVRPEMGAIAGSIAVWIFFAIVAGNSGFLTLSGTATYLSVSAELGILAVAVALLMIGGEFDLSIGSMIGATSMIITILSAQFGWNIWASILVAVVFALAIGFLNGYLVLRTGLPSFIVTLGSLYIIRGVTIGVTRALTGRTQVGGLDLAPGYDSAHAIFASPITIGGASFPIEIVWWLVIAALATWVLLRTSFGNWIFGVGGDVQAARNVGVPVKRVKITLFMMTALAACLLAAIQAITFTGSDVLRGQDNEFLTIIAVVVGGTLLTGGYGSAIGSVFGALIFGMVRQGIVFAGVDADWYQAFLGVMLLLAVLLNSYVRKYALEVRR